MFFINYEINPQFDNFKKSITIIQSKGNWINISNLKNNKQWFKMYFDIYSIIKYFLRKNVYIYNFKNNIFYSKDLDLYTFKFD